MPTLSRAVRFLTGHYRRSVPVATISTRRLPHREHTSRACQSGMVASAHNARPFRRGRADLMAAPHSALLGLWRGALIAIAVLPLVAHIAPLPETYRSMAPGSTRETKRGEKCATFPGVSRYLRWRCHFLHFR